MPVLEQSMRQCLGHPHASQVCVLDEGTHLGERVIESQEHERSMDGRSTLTTSV